MKKLIFYAFFFGLALAFASCSTDSLLSNSDSSESNKFSSEDYFDYSMTENVTFAVNYGNDFGAKTLMEVFTEDPTGTDEEPIRSDIEPVYKGYTNAKGMFEGDVTLPTSVEKVWLVNRAFCLPMIVEANVNNGYVEYENNSNATSNSKAKDVTSRAADSESDYQVELVYQASGDAGYYSITKIEDQYGSVRNNALVSENSTLGGGAYSTYIKNLQSTLWNGKDSKPSGLNNSKYALGSDIINTVIKSSYTDDNGATHNVESADINIIFMTEAGWYESALGYYYYKTGTNPSAKDVKKFIAIPNTSVTGGYPYISGKLGTDNAPAYPGESVSLLFEKEDGTYTKHFPAGYTIGYFLLGNGYDSSNKKIITTANQSVYYGKTQGPIFSNEAWNNNVKKYIAFSLPSGEIVYGLEDGGDNSYEDNLFILQGTPNEAIENPELPVINPEKGTITTTTETTNRTYAFEDKFPYYNGCDYDMNDVIVGHKRNIVFDESNNVQKVTDEYTFKQEKDALSYTDGFAVQMNPSYLGSSLIITDGSGKDITSSVKVYADTKHNNWNTYILCEDAKANTGKTFTVTRVFNGSCTKAKFDAAEAIDAINPFVISQYTNDAYNSGTLTEVHFAGNDPMTSKGNSEYDNNGNQYYIGLAGEDNEYFPYALSIPKAEFTAPQPGVRIDKTYSKFKPWANSKGTTNQDWYTSPD